MSEENKDSEFYVGYLPKMPEGIAKSVRSLVWVIAIALPIMAYLLVSNQWGYRAGTFELGKLSEVSGVLELSPVPMLKVPLGRGQFQSVMLIGFGKSGAAPTIRQIEEEQGQRLEGQLVTLEGTLIYYDGKALLELTKKGKAFKKALGKAPLEYQSSKKILGQQVLRGEIVDAKCYFGVMKPGEGKPHRSCAANCIAGGIPATLRTINEFGAYQYLILTGPNGESVNKDVLSFVGEPVELKGTIEQIDDWLYFKFDPNKDTKRLHTLHFPNPPMCRPQLSQR